jgi:hypothetical protein
MAKSTKSVFENSRAQDFHLPLALGLMAPKTCHKENNCLDDLAESQDALDRYISLRPRARILLSYLNPYLDTYLINE